MTAKTEAVMTDDATEPGDEIGYADAMTELETILSSLEQDDVDIDLLATNVKRAAGLIRLCRSRIEGARMEVEHIVSDMAAD